MNLYRIKVKHLSRKDSHTSIQGYIVAEDESELYDILCDGVAYWNEKLYETMYNNVNNFSKLANKIPSWFEENNEVVDFSNAPKEHLTTLEELWKEYVISTKGELNSDWANYDDLFYGQTHYGWELVKEGVDDSELDVLSRLDIITNN